jgi:hypothetical protein
MRNTMDIVVGCGENCGLAHIIEIDFDTLTATPQNHVLPIPAADVTPQCCRMAEAFNTMAEHYRVDPDKFWKFVEEIAGYARSTREAKF